MRAVTDGSQHTIWSEPATRKKKTNSASCQPQKGTKNTQKEMYSHGVEPTFWMQERKDSRLTLVPSGEQQAACCLPSRLPHLPLPKGDNECATSPESRKVSMRKTKHVYLGLCTLRLRPWPHCVTQPVAASDLVSSSLHMVDVTSIRGCILATFLSSECAR